MIFFLIVEIFNKLAGLYITGFLARLLSPPDLGQYFSTMVMLGYAIELGFFGSQNRNNADYASDYGYLGSTKFAARRTLSILATAIAIAFLSIAVWDARGVFDIGPLLITVALVPFTYDYIAYGEGRSRLVVLARLASQLILVAWITVVAQDIVSARQLFWGQLLQTSTLTLVLICGLRLTGLLPWRALSLGLLSLSLSVNDVRTAFRDQLAAFTLRVLALALVSGELLYLEITGNTLANDVAISLRLVQVMFPFVVFYVDSKVRNVGKEHLQSYVTMVFVAGCAVMLAAPVLVRLLYGQAYAESVEQIVLFLPAFAIQAVLQYSVMMSLKENSERELLLRLLAPILTSAVGMFVVLGFAPTISALSVAYAAKAVVFMLVVPGLAQRARIAGIGLVTAIVTLNPVLDACGFYRAMINMIATLLP